MILSKSLSFSHNSQSTLLASFTKLFSRSIQIATSGALGRTNSQNGCSTCQDHLKQGPESSRLYSSAADIVLRKYDTIQVKLMEEACILVNQKDENIGSESKKIVHLLEKINEGMLHRAFSVFLFNCDNKLLLQQRSDHKITFPGLWTNTCCSHPLHTQLEIDEKNAMGVKRAAQRRLYTELGIPPDQIPLEMFQYITRIQYMAENIPADGIFGENEIDYILILKKEKAKTVQLGLNWNEVKNTKFVTADELREMLERHDGGEVILTPWFRLICERFLFDWWANLKKLKKKCDHKNIHKLT